MKKLMSFSLVFFTSYLTVFSQCWQTVSAGNGYTIAIKPDGTLWAFGLNFDGRLGDGTENNIRESPVKISLASNWKSISANYNYTLALKTDGTIWAWGNNEYGQLGDGTKIKKNLPTQVGSDMNWAYIATGLGHSLAIKTDGTLWAWGFNYYEQLGDGTNVDKTVPTQIGNENNWATISAGSFSSFAIKTNKTLWAWGNNNLGTLGDGTTVSKNVPTQMGIETNWLTVSSKSNHTAALKTDGTLWAWGLNEEGEVGNGTSGTGNYQMSRTQIGGTDWKSISIGYAFTLAIKTDGTLWAWGDNNFGEIGNGTNTNQNIPTKIGSATDWQFISAGAGLSLAIKNNGAFWGWGSNMGGQFGNGTNSINYSPILLTCPASLPIEFLFFQAKILSNQNLLTWQTATETNNQGFEIERSLNGIDFEKLGFLKGVGNSNQIQSYRFIDANPFNVTYYRLKQIDFDGKFDYSNTISIKIGKEKSIQFYPNPTNGIITIESDAILNADILIYNTIGKLVKTTKAQNNTINISDLPKGVYMVSMTNNENRIVKQIVKM
jgi:alpha-tubulin suppressor-like RCC1 family protein